jgi:hypothetical protein
MRVLISGPRSRYDEDGKLSHLHIELDLEELPKKGETIILNSGGSYVVTDIMWWVNGPENEAYWSRGDYSTTEGRYQICHINVEPSDYRRQTYTMDGMRREGYEAGQKAAARELASRLLELAKAGEQFSTPQTQLAVVAGWLASNGAGEEN